MEPNERRGNARDFFLNLGAIVSLYTVIISLVNLLFTIINKAYPQITNGYNYYGTPSISWPVATLVIFFPILVLMMWLLEKQYRVEPDRQNFGIHRWLTYITLFLSGIAMAADLITVLYYFIDGQELTTGFLLKVLVLLVVAAGIFTYYLSDVRGTLTSSKRKIWRVVTGVVIVGSIVWGFSVIGSPATQRLYKYDTQKLNDLQNITGQVNTFYSMKGFLPQNLKEVADVTHYPVPVDVQSGKAYEYHLVGQSAAAYQICAEFNKASTDNNGDRSSIFYPTPYGSTSWTHPAGRHCFDQSIDPTMYPTRKLPM